MRPTAGSLAYDQWISIAQSAGQAGCGDCVRVLPQRNGQALFFLADVAGHDARAARIAGELDARVSELAGVSGPGLLLTILNAALEATWPPDLFVSAVCFSIDPDTGSGSVAAAGQLPPIVKGASSSSPVGVAGGPPLGVFGEHSYLDRPFSLTAGDVLVAVTDGISDPLATGGDLLGLSAVARLVHRAPPDRADVCDVLLRAARRAGLQDDATILAVAPPCGAVKIPALPRTEWPRLAA